MVMLTMVVDASKPMVSTSDCFAVLCNHEVINRRMRSVVIVIVDIEAVVIVVEIGFTVVVLVMTEIVADCCSRFQCAP